MNQDLLTLLARSRCYLLKFASMSAVDFRLDYLSNFNRLSYAVWDDLIMLTNHSECQVEWFSYLVATDMLDILLRVAGVATQEIDISSCDTIDAIIVWLIVWEILPEMMLTNYSMYSGEIMLLNEWNLLLRNLECNKRDVHNVSHQTSHDPPIIAITTEQLYDNMKSVNAHSQQFHPKDDEYSCKEHQNSYQYSGSPSPSHLSDTNTQESQDSSQSVGINVDSDDNISQSYNMFMLDMIS
jgi:hypothetical protein